MQTADYWSLYAQCVQQPSVTPSCEQLFQALRPTFQRIASRIAYQFSSPCEIDDIVQEIHLKLVTDGSIQASLPREESAAIAFFSVVAANAARDYFRKLRAARRDTRRTLPLESAPLSRLARDLDCDREILLQQIENCVPSGRREQIIFRLWYRTGLTAREIAAIPALKLNHKGVESFLDRVMNSVRRCLKNKLSAATKG
jgi:RNA polymerase sigma factor (sigma-70 family)